MAWDSQCGLYSVTQIDFENKMVKVYRENNGYIGKGKFALDRVKLLPCTGHKDINEKPLFEGAIITFNDNLYEVCYSDRQGFTVANSVNWFEVIFADKCSEIVGNIYENEDLKKEVRGE